MKRTVMITGGIGGILVAFIVWWFGGHYYAAKLHLMRVETWQVYRMIAYHARDHDGQLPASMDDLVKQGYVQWVIREGRRVAVVPSARRSGEFIIWYDQQFPIEHWNEFKLAVTGNLQDFEVRDDLAYKKGTDNICCWLWCVYCAHTFAWRLS